MEQDAPPQKVVVIMGEQDESVPFAGVAEAWKRWESSGRLAAGSRFVCVPGGDHGLIGSVDRIVEVIRSI